MHLVLNGKCIHVQWVPYQKALRSYICSVPQMRVERGTNDYLEETDGDTGPSRHVRFCHLKCEPPGAGSHIRRVFAVDLLRVCKLFHSDVLQLLLKNNTFVFQSFDDLRQFLSRISRNERTLPTPIYHAHVCEPNKLFYWLGSPAIDWLPYPIEWLSNDVHEASSSVVHPHGNLRERLETVFNRYFGRWAALHGPSPGKILVSLNSKIELPNLFSVPYSPSNVRHISMNLELRTREEVHFDRMTSIRLKILLAWFMKSRLDCGCEQ